MIFSIHMITADGFFYSLVTVPKHLVLLLNGTGRRLMETPYPSHPIDVQAEAECNEAKDNNQECLLVTDCKVLDFTCYLVNPCLLCKLPPCIDFIIVSFPVLGIVLVGHLLTD